MKAVFKELTSFARVRADYLSDSEYSQMQQDLMSNPEAGDVIKETGGYASCDGRTADEERASVAVFE